MSTDWIALIASFIYVFAMIGVAEGLRKWRGYLVEFTRKFIHIAVGMWAFGTVLLFERRASANHPAASVRRDQRAILLAREVKMIETGEQGQLGTI
jgi:hypothetical protein